MKAIVMLCILVLPLAAQPKKKTESFWSKVLRIAGISANPTALRGADTAAAGDVWVATPGSRTAPQRLTRDGGYYSPVFDAGGQSILVLKSGNLFRVPLTGDVPTNLRSLPGLTKLVGLSRDDDDQLLALAKNSQNTVSAVLLSIRTGAVTPLPHDPASREDGLLLVHLAGWERVYGDVRLYCEEEEKDAPGGVSIRFTDVYLKHGSDAPVNLSNGNGTSSCQPSLSPDGKRVAFIRGDR
jgi:hypothetical protein